jgi:hypothetical protein
VRLCGSLCGVLCASLALARMETFVACVPSLCVLCVIDLGTFTTAGGQTHEGERLKRRDQVLRPGDSRG